MTDESGAEGEREVKALGEYEMNVAHAGPAPFTNRFFVTFYGTTVRIAFAEQFPGRDSISFRSAVSMNIADAANLNDLLTRMLAKPKAVEILKSFLESAVVDPE